MNGHNSKPLPSSGNGPGPRTTGRNSDSVAAQSIEDPRSVEEAEAILQQMARAVSLERIGLRSCRDGTGAGEA